MQLAMGGTGLTRRRMLGALGGAGAAALGGFAVTNATANSDWTVVGSPTGNSIYDVAYAGSKPYAVGSSGSMFARSNGSWSTVTSSAGGRNKDLKACAATDDGERVWYCGTSGTVGYLDRTTGGTVDHSNPVGDGNTFYDVAVSGSAGNSYVFLTSSSGTVVVGNHESQSVSWASYDTGSGSTVTATDFYDKSNGYAVTNASTVYRTSNGGQYWKRVGIPNSQVPLKAVVAGPNHVYVGGGSGRLYRLDCTCSLWTPFKPGAATVSALDRYEKSMLGAGSSGHVVERTHSGYRMYGTPTGNHLYGVAVGRGGGPDVAVGDSGTIVER